MDIIQQLLYISGYFLLNFAAIFFIISVIIYLIHYQRRDATLSNKEKLNYNLCATYLVQSFAILLINFGYIKGILFGLIATVSMYIRVGVNITSYYFYIYLFSLALKRNKDDNNNNIRFILYWSIILVYCLFFISVGIKLAPLLYITSFIISISNFWIVIQEIRYLIKICKEYKKAELTTEEEVTIQEKNYNRLVIFGVVQIVFFVLSDIYSIYSMIKVQSGTCFDFYMELFSLVVHILFMFFFVYDEDSLIVFKRICLCKKKEVTQDELMISTVLVNDKD